MVEVHVHGIVDARGRFVHDEDPGERVVLVGEIAEEVPPAPARARHAAGRGVRRISIGNFRDVTETGVFQMF